MPRRGIASPHIGGEAATGLLFGVEAVDATTFTTISVLLVIVSLLACYLPARRAMRIDPMMALCYE